ncbi:endonuclease/exonuclease/phosphatase family protein [Streptomyces sp. NPDC048106]|uniref:endonuclease/exonuclease/phosphatase family protein n=1 Tax=Streptomyces sp. NPDC048106 TaxID=3155750 RepID=UPI0034541678
MAATDTPGGDPSAPPAEEDTGRDSPDQAPDTADQAPDTPEEAPDAPEEAPAARRWCRGTRLLVAGTALWTVFLTLHVLLIGRWWPWHIVEVIPPLTMVAVPLLLLALVPFAAPVRRWLSAVLVLLLLAGAHVAGFGWPDTTAGGARGTKVKVFAWSTDYWQMTSGNKEAFYAFLRRQDADVYLLHEYLNWNYWSRDEQKRCTSPVRIDDSARLHAEFPGYRLLVQGELVTLSRLPVVAAPHQHVPTTGDDWYWKGSKAQRTDIRVGRRTVSFYNVHLPIRFRPCDIRYGWNRFTQANKDQGDWWRREYRNLRADLGSNPHPAVVAGDFNTAWMNDYPLGSGIQSHNPSGSLFPARSWPACDGSCSLPRSWRILPELWRFDWLFTTKSLTVTSYHLHGGESLSDHSAQQIRVVVPS